MTEKQLRVKAVNTAKSWLGKRESDGSFKEIIDLYNSIEPLPVGYKVTYTDEWCAAFVSAVFAKAELSDIGFPECSCERMIALYKKAGRWKEADDYVPEMGDVVMYDWQDSGIGDDTGWADHVGIVELISGNDMRILEGNISNSVGRRYLKVDGRYIRGYCLPDYASVASPKADSGMPTVSDPTRVKIDPAYKFDKSLARSYTVNIAELPLHSGADITKPVLKVLPRGARVTCYGYFTSKPNNVWLYVVAEDGTVGHCLKRYLE